MLLGQVPRFAEYVLVGRFLPVAAILCALLLGGCDSDRETQATSSSSQAVSIPAAKEATSAYVARSQGERARAVSCYYDVASRTVCTVDMSRDCDVFTVIHGPDGRLAVRPYSGYCVHSETDGGYTLPGAR